MTGRSRGGKRSTLTRRITRELGPAYDVIASTMLGYAEVIDDPETRPTDRLRALSLWLETYQQLGGQLADEARSSSSSWGAGGLQAV